MGCDNSCASRKAASPAGGGDNGEPEGRTRKERKRRKKARHEQQDPPDSSSAPSIPRKKRGKGRGRAHGPVREGSVRGNEGGGATSSSDQSDASARVPDSESKAVVASAVEQPGSPQLAPPMNIDAPVPVARPPKPKFSASSTCNPAGRAGLTSLPPNPLLPRSPSMVGSDHSLASERRRGAGSPRAPSSRSEVSSSLGRSAGANMPAAKRNRIQRWIDSGYYTELLDPQNVAEQRQLEERFQQERRTANSSTSSSPSSASTHYTAPASTLAVKASLKPDLSTSSSRRETEDIVVTQLMAAGVLPPEKEHSSNSTLAPKSPSSAQLSGPSASEAFR